MLSSAGKTQGAERVMVHQLVVLRTAQEASVKVRLRFQLDALYTALMRVMGGYDMIGNLET